MAEYENTITMNGEMANLDFDDDYEYGDMAQEPEDWEGEQPTEEPIEEEPKQQQSNDWLSSVLRTKGISDPNKIKFADDNDEIQERSWEELSDEEKFNILTTSYDDDDEPQDISLTDEEIQLLNSIRQNNLTPTEYLTAVVQSNLEQYAASQKPVYTVDSISDDELFMGDLKLRTPDITDEELLNALDAAKANPELFEKQIQGLRTEYQGLEDQKLEEQRAIEEQQNQEQYQQFQEQIFDGIDALESLSPDVDVELTDDDKEELASYILDYDQAGVTQLQKDLANPETLAKVAWFLLKGEETIDGLIQYFKREISNVRETSFKKGQGSPEVVVKPKKQQPMQRYRKITTLDELD